MEKYDYLKALKEDIHNYIKDNDVLDYEYETRDDLYDTLYDELICSDIVGNDGYYSTKEKCEDYICHNLDLAFQAMNDLCIGLDKEVYMKIVNNPAQYLDAIIRIYLLGEALDAVLSELGVEDRK